MSFSRRKTLFILLGALWFFVVSDAWAGEADSFVPLGDSLRMTQHDGSNLLVLKEKEALMLFLRFDTDGTPALAEVLERFGDATKVVLLTHWHPGVSPELPREGGATPIFIMQERVRTTLGQTALPAAWPRVAFEQHLHLDFAGEELWLHHVPDAHGVGDTLVEFRDSKLLYVGDIFSAFRFPSFDPSSGASASGMLAAIDRSLALAGEGWRIVPGQGEILSVEDLKGYRYMLRTVVDRVTVLKAAGHSFEALVAAEPAREFMGQWGADEDSLKRFLRLLYEED